MNPRILVVDIETAPIKAYLWNLYSRYTPIDRIIDDSYVIAWSAMWLQETPLTGDYEKDKAHVIYRDQRREKDIENDKASMQELRKLIDEADMTLTHNGKQFDHKKLNSRFIINGIHPPSSYRMIDTKDIASKYFGFTSNKLAYLTEKLNKKYKKLDHEAFPGFKLWDECMKGNHKAWEAMKEYNIYDVLSLAELYQEHFKPWDVETNYFVYQDEVTCRCGSEDYKKNGWHYAQTRKYQRYKCLDCGYEWRDVRAARCARFTSTVKR